MDNKNKISEATIEKANADIVAVIGRYLPLKKMGTDYNCPCPFHQEKTPSFTVSPNKLFYYCFGCGAGGDAISFVMDYERLNFPDAVRRIIGEFEPGSGEPTPMPAKVVEDDEWQPILPVPDEALRPMDTIHRNIDGTWVAITASRQFEFTDIDGALLGYTMRFERFGGGKEVLPQTYCVNTKTGEMKWRWRSFNKPRPIYGLHRLATNNRAQIVFCEGEKAAFDGGKNVFEAAGIPSDKLITLSWPGGTKAVKYVDFSPLAGRSVGLWPDADQKVFPVGHALAGQRVPYLEQPGVACMLEVAALIKDIAASVKIFVPPTDVDDGWDLADPLPDGFDIKNHLRTQSMTVDDFVKKFSHVDAIVPQGMNSPAAVDMPENATDNDEAPAVGKHDNNLLFDNGYFNILGYDGDEYFFFSHEKRQIMIRTKSDFSDTGINELAPLNWWEEYFPAEKGGMDRKQVVNWLFRSCNSRGIYDSSRVRGRGAWIDLNRVVYHHGAFLTVDGVQTEITRIKSGYVYPMSRSMPMPGEPMSDAEGQHLVHVASLARWSMPASAAIMSGFCLLAAICGSLSWRPHIWIAGPAGSGKTFLQMKFCGGLTKGYAVVANGNSTEAGIRQELKGDALPVLIDEFESNNERERLRVENVMSLIRQTSSDTQAKTLKGTVTGSGMHYDIRSMFCLASINTNLPTGADVDRLTILTLKSDKIKGVDNWHILEGELARIDEDTDISRRLLARSLSLMPVIQAAIKVFRRVATKKFERQRDGDQYGTLMAGCWCLQHSVVPTEEDALKMIDSYDWSEHREDVTVSDALVALEAILAAKLRVGTSGEFSVFELIREADTSFTSTRHGVIDGAVAAETLKRHGIRAEFGSNELWFGVSVSSLKHLVDGMPFVTDLKGQLLRIPGAKRLESSKKFNGVDSRCISIPLSPILAGDEQANKTPVYSQDSFIPDFDIDDPF